MTKQEFESILPCYFGQKVINDNGEIGTIDEINRKDNGELLVLCYDTVQAYYNQGEFKLILRTMGDIIDEEYVQFARIAYPNYYHHPHNYLYMQFRITGRLNLSIYGIEGCVRQINYLRSIGIDCDGLIEAGYAVREKGLNQSVIVNEQSK